MNGKHRRKYAVCLFYSSVLRWSIQLWAWLVTAAPARPRMQRTSVIASSQKCPRHGSEGRLGSGPRLVDRIGLGVRVSASFHILSCAVVCAVVQAAFRDTRTRWKRNGYMGWSRRIYNYFLRGSSSNILPMYGQNRAQTVARLQHDVKT